MARPRSARSAETRTAIQRPEMETSYESMFFFPKSRWPKGMTCRWVRVAVDNQPDNKRWAQAYKDGWRPCAPEIAPEYVIPNVDGSRPSTALIRLADHVLCQMPTADVKARQAAIDHRTQQQLQTLDDFVRENPDADIPRFNRSGQTETGLAPADAFKD